VVLGSAGIVCALVGAAVSSPGADGTRVSGADRVAGPSSVRAAAVVARTDVDGDGVRDVVHYRAINRKLARIRVDTSGGERLRKDLDVSGWPRGHFLGAARLDGRRGAELFVGTLLGAHTPWYTVLTYRRGALVVEHNPGASYPEWVVDAYANGYVGWTRTVRHGHVYAVLRDVFRVSTSHRWRGKARRFQWGAHGWVKAGTRTLSITGDRRASHIGGWHVPGLPRWS
jgi:hypothetical protein